MSKEKTDVTASELSPKVLKAADPETIKLIHEYLDKTKGVNQKGKPINKLRRYIRKSDDTHKTVADNTYTFTNSKNEPVQIAVDESVLVFNADNPKTRKLFILKSKIGSGAFGRVKDISKIQESGIAEIGLVNLQTGQENVVKIIAFVKKGETTQLRRVSEDEAINEALLERELGDSEGYMVRESVYGHKIYIILPKHPGKDLFDHYQDRNIKDLDEKLEIAIKILQQLKDRFHSKGFIHRDLKPENIMYDKETRKLRIVDLAFAKKGQKPTAPNDIKRSGSLYYRDENLKGTDGYLAPESIYYKDYSEKTDVFAIGRTFAGMLNLSALVTFTHQNGTITGVQAVKTSPHWTPYHITDEESKLGKAGSEKLKSLVLDMAENDCNNRIGLDEAITRLQEVIKIRKEKIKGLSKENQEEVRPKTMITSKMDSDKENQNTKVDDVADKTDPKKGQPPNF